jgi:sugar lactone lactonase YvrE
VRLLKESHFLFKYKTLWIFLWISLGCWFSGGLLYAQIIVNVAGTGTGGFSGDGGPATLATFSHVGPMQIDGTGNLYVTDLFNNRIRVINTVTGIVTTFAGNGTAGFSGDGGPATLASLNGPQYVALDGHGHMAIADTTNNRIRVVDMATGIITTIAGNGTAGYTGDGGPATSAELNRPYAAIYDAAGNLYISDSNNNVIRKVAAGTGIITTIAGNGTAVSSGDGGPALSAGIDTPFSLAFDPSGNLAISDTGGARIRYMNLATGIITTIAGNGAAGYSGDGGPATSAQLNAPVGITYDSKGDLFIADYRNNRVRMVAPGTGTITTIAGTGVAGTTGDGGLATSAELDNPARICPDNLGNIYVGDEWSNRVREIVLVPVAPAPTPTMITGPVPQSYFNVSKNVFTPSQGALTITAIVYDYPGDVSLKIYNTAGELVKKLLNTHLTGPLTVTIFPWDGTNTNGQNCASGVYIIVLTEPFGRRSARVLLVR